MNSKDILKFEYDNIWYFVEKNNKDYKYYFLENGKKNYSLNDNQVKIVQSVIKRFLPSRDWLFITKYKYNNIVYDVLLDRQTHLYFFNPIPKKEDLIHLNYFFNNVNEYVNSELNQPKNKDEKYFKRIINVLNKKTIIYFLCSIITVEFAAIAYFSKDMLYDTEDHFRVVEKLSYISDEQLSDKMKLAILDNNHLSDQEKNHLLQYIDVIVDNKDYININYADYIFRTLKIKYKQDYKYTSNDSKKTGNIVTNGEYAYFTNTINYYGVSDYSEVQPSVLDHEICHALTKYDFYTCNDFLIETTNTIFNQDYNNCKENNIYNNYLNYTKAMMEIIGVEPFKKYHAFSSDDIIIDALCEIIDDKDKATSFIERLNIYKKTYDSYLENRENKELNENKELLEEQIYNDIKDYYEEKKGIDMQSDLLMLYYVSPKEFSIIADEMFGADDIKVSYAGVKNYFNSKTNNGDLIMIVKTYQEEVDGVLKDVTYYEYISDGNRIIDDDFALG